jgi:hypothetical protein
LSPPNLTPNASEGSPTKETFKGHDEVVGAHVPAGQVTDLEQAMLDVGATITVEWGYDLHSITLAPNNWTRVKSGESLSIRGKGYWYDGEFFWDRWSFGGGLGGSLEVTYGDDGGVGFAGMLSNAIVEECATPAVADRSPKCRGRSVLCESFLSQTEIR